MDQPESSSSTFSSSSFTTSSQSTQDTSTSTSNPSSSTAEEHIEHNTVKPVVVDLDNLSLSDDDSETTDDSSSETETESGSEDEEATAPSKTAEVVEPPPKVYTGPAVADKFFVGSATTPGTNRYNEDRAVILPALGGRPTHAYFGVYDGHGGTKCSDFCVKFLAETISKEPTFDTDMKEALVEGFIKTDKRFLKKQESCGSTVNVAIVTSDGILVANTGDCRAIVSVGGEAIALSEDHKPSDPKEQQRIEAARHEVTTETVLVKGKRLKISRIDGMIAVSRGIGDPDFKDEPELPPGEQAISCVPDFKELSLTPDLRFLLLACDGLWDVMSNKQVVDYVEEHLTALVNKKKDSLSDGGDLVLAQESLNHICQELVNDAVHKFGSTDNVTAILVVFKGHFTSTSASSASSSPDSSIATPSSSSSTPSSSSSPSSSSTTAETTIPQ